MTDHINVAHGDLAMHHERMLRERIAELEALLAAEKQHAASLAKQVERKQKLLEESTAQVERLENALLGIKRPTETLDERGTHDDHSTD